jgi:hypothetical protein
MKPTCWRSVFFGDRMLAKSSGSIITEVNGLKAWMERVTPLTPWWLSARLFIRAVGASSVFGTGRRKVFGRTIRHSLLRTLCKASTSRIAQTNLPGRLRGSPRVLRTQSRFVHQSQQNSILVGRRGATRPSVGFLMVLLRGLPWLRSPQQSQMLADRMVYRGEILHRCLQVSRSFQTRPGHDCFFA